ncbi:MAG: nucleotide exchange factor GrpE [Thermoplasmata archaeon]|nr:nucleotide exchange factor GrpE [Thermoplasmata archaeon]
MDPDKLTQEMKDDIWIRDEYSCRFCGDTIGRHELTVTFLLPLEQGGTRSLANVVSKCPRCVREGVISPITGEAERSVVNLMRDLLAVEHPKDELELDRDLEEEVKELNYRLISLTEEAQSLMEELDKKTSLAIAYKKKLERSQKDYDNLKRRQSSDVEMRVKNGMKDLIMGIIDTVDNMERGIVEAQKLGDNREMSSLISGMNVILKSLLHTLKNNDVKRIDPLGKPFDPKVHEALKTMVEERAFENTVIEVESAGYMLGDTLLRPAKVVVSRGGTKRPRPEEEVEWDQEEDLWGDLAKDIEEELEWEEE